MKKVTFLLAIVFVFAFSLSSTTKTEAAGQKVTICHIPPGNPDNAHEITVSINALDAHLAHGDSIGGCEDWDNGRNR